MVSWQVCLYDGNPYTWKDIFYIETRQIPGCLNIKMPSYQYSDSHYKDKDNHTWLYYLSNGTLHTSKDGLYIEQSPGLHILRKWEFFLHTNHLGEVIFSLSRSWSLFTKWEWVKSPRLLLHLQIISLSKVIVGFYVISAWVNSLRLRDAYMHQ